MSGAPGKRRGNAKPDGAAARTPSGAMRTCLLPVLLRIDCLACVPKLKVQVGA